MEEEKKLEMRFNQILIEEMGKVFELKPLPLDPDLKIKYSEGDKSVYIKSEYLDYPKTSGMRTGDLDLKGSMLIHFGNVPPASGYDVPVLGYTFVYANKCLIVVLDLLPVSRDKEYMDKYIAPLKEVSQKYEWVPRVEGSREEVAEWAKPYDSGFSIYLWCDKQYVPDIENAFRDYIRVFCDCIKKAEPLADQETLAKRDRHMEKYIADYINNDVGGAPLRSHFGKDWGERYMKEFFFAP
jgi:15,16-dihydrobiliverdin:ferredoxin oxidoreductase